MCFKKSPFHKNSNGRSAAKDDGTERRKIFDSNEQTAILRSTQGFSPVRIAVLLMLLGALSATAMGQCGASFNSMAAAAASVRNNPQMSQLTAQDQSTSPGDIAVNTSIVGLWHISFLVGGEQIQEAFQTWNTGGTEVHNPNVDPRQGSVCLGTWDQAAPQTFKLNHRVWLYTPDGSFLGVGHLHETLTLSDRGNTQNGSFTLDLYDLSGNKLAELAAGTVKGERISVSEP
jgi:hypothetical protein